MGKKAELKGKRFSDLTVIEEAGKNKHNQVIWLCKCNCGNETKVTSTKLINNRTKSCGCRITTAKDIAGKQFGKLTAINASGKRKSYRGVVWNCLCECGNHHQTTTASLVQGRVKSCGCARKGKVSHSRIDLTGKKYHRLTVIEYVETKNNRARWLCKCDCGNESIVDTASLRNGNTRSCGCFNSDRIAEVGRNSATHGHWKNGKPSFTYVTWRAMKGRCYNPKVGGYDQYGAKGYTVCDRWLESFENFLEDMGECPDDTDENGRRIYTIERIDNYKKKDAYCKENCIWADKKTQSRNQKRYDEDYDRVIIDVDLTEDID